MNEELFEFAKNNDLDFSEATDLQDFAEENEIDDIDEVYEAFQEM